MGNGALPNGLSYRAHPRLYHLRRPAMSAPGSIIAYWHDPKSGAGQCLDDRFRNLFGLLGVYSTVRMILASIANRRRDYRNHLVLIGHIVLPVLNSEAVPTAVFGTKRSWCTWFMRSTMKALPRMTDDSDPFNGLDLQETIDLRWMLRDIRAKRWKLSPVNPSHLEKLETMNLIEMLGDEPALTKAGL